MTKNDNNSKPKKVKVIPPPAPEIEDDFLIDDTTDFRKDGA
jgi:hypothetical protein